MIVLLQVTVLLWVCVMAHVLIAFRRSAMVISGSGIHHIMGGVFWIILAAIFRGVFWDVIPMLTGKEAFYAFVDMVHDSTWPNMIFYVIMMVAGMRLMYGFWLMLPVEDRSSYNIFTAAFYPKKLRIIIKEKVQ